VVTLLAIEACRFIDHVEDLEMQINTNNYSIAEIIEMLDRRELIVNREYQRGSGLWPAGPSSYFIDTILEGFPFPKIYMYEFMTRPDRKLRKEIVDGQQRISSIVRFHNNEYAVSGDSKYVGLRFSDLDDELKDRFLSYSVSVDVIRNAHPSDILQMFRRMNAFTLPLNEAEKRHSSFQGSFKWTVNALTDSLNPFFVEFGVFTNREIVRMADAELVSECVLAMERGVISTSASDLRALYKKYDDAFPEREMYSDRILAAVEFISGPLEPLRRTFMMKPYALLSLLTALIHCRFGIEALSANWAVEPLGRFCANENEALENLIALAMAHEGKEVEGPYYKYVWSTIGGTNRAPRRTARVAAILRALGAHVPDAVDADLPS
jgi:hypothetical protein